MTAWGKPGSAVICFGVAQYTLFLKKQAQLQEEEMRNLCTIQFILSGYSTAISMPQFLPFKNRLALFSIHKDFTCVVKSSMHDQRSFSWSNIISNVTFDSDKPRYKW